MTRVALCFAIVLSMSARKAAAQQVRADTLLMHFAFDQSAVRAADAKRIVQYFTHRRDSVKLIDSDSWKNPAGIDSVNIYAYTDTVGTAHYNLLLSERRARALMQFSFLALLPEWRRGSPTGHMYSLGEADPLPGDDSLSRRALLIVYYRVNPAPIVHIDTPRVKAPGEPDTVLTLDHINFVANKAELTQAALDALPSNVANLRHFRDRYLEIDGFCNQPGPPLAKTDILFILSVNRAKFIYEYLISQGFDSTHLSYKGLGNASPVNAHPTTTTEMDQNMRVEIKVFHDPPKPSTAQ